MIYGVIGVGGIAAAMVTGLCAGVAAPPSVLLSPRNADVAAGLAARYPTVHVCADNQAVVDGVDVLVLCLRPVDFEAVLAGLRFRAEQAVVSVMAGVAMERLRPLLAPASDIARAIPLPAVAHRRGETPIFPATRAAGELFERLGGVRIASDVAAFDALSAVSGTIAAHLAVLDAIARWLAQHGISNQESVRHVASVYAALANPLQEAHDFSELADEFTTPGGLNALFRTHLDEIGTVHAVSTGLEKLLLRLTSSLASTYPSSHE